MKILIFCQLILLMFNQDRNLFSRSEPIPLGIAVLNHTMLQTWYDPIQICMMKDRQLTNGTYRQYLEECEAELSLNGTKLVHPYSTGFAVLNSGAGEKRSRDGCCNSDIQIKDRGFDWVVKGYENGKEQHVTQLMTFLSKHNMSLIFMGDSMNSQIFAAFLEECSREGIEGSFNHDAKGSFSWIQNPEEYGLDRKILSNIRAIIKFDWSLKKKASAAEDEGFYNNSIYLYDINMWLGKRARYNDRLIMEIILPLISNEHPLVILPNIGLHLESGVLLCL
jgi:hypothetical protein